MMRLLFASLALALSTCSTVAVAGGVGNLTGTAKDDTLFPVYSYGAVFDGKGGADTLDYAKASSDYKTYRPADVRVDLTTRQAYSTGRGGMDRVTGIRNVIAPAGSNNVSLVGNADSNLLSSRAINSIVDGKAGDDVLEGVGGSYMRGGEGRDLFRVVGAGGGTGKVIIFDFDPAEDRLENPLGVPVTDWAGKPIVAEPVDPTPPTPPVKPKPPVEPEPPVTPTPPTVTAVPPVPDGYTRQTYRGRKRQGAGNGSTMICYDRDQCVRGAEGSQAFRIASGGVIVWGYRPDLGDTIVNPSNIKVRLEKTVPKGWKPQIVEGEPVAPAPPVSPQPPAEPETPPTAKTRPGINLSGGEFRDAVYPNAADIRYYARLGFLDLRIPIKWDRLQKTLFGELDPVALKALDEMDAAAKAEGATLLIEDHSYGRRRAADGKLYQIGDPQFPVEAHVDFMLKVAKRYPDAKIGTQNEPYDKSPDSWAAKMQRWTILFRAGGGTNEIVHDGTGSSGVGRWVKEDHSPSLAFGNALNKLNGGKGYIDPLNRTAWDLHSYLDGNWSGTSASCASNYSVVVKATEWALAWHQTLYMGEHAYAGHGKMHPSCAERGPSVSNYMRAHPTVWKIIYWWGGGRAWADGYMFKWESKKGTRGMVPLDPYQLQTLGVANQPRVAAQ